MISKCALALSLVMGLVGAGFGQVPVTFRKLPATLQLFARDSTNQADVTVDGTVTGGAYERVSVQVWREGQPWARTVQSLSADASFSIQTKIRAERAQYTFRVFLYTGRDSVLAAERTRIVCGDFIQIYGQSNAVALAGLETYPFDDTYLRNCTYGSADDIPGTMRWYAAREPHASVGMIGWRLQERILAQFGIPTCIINGAVGGTSIDWLSARTADNPADLSNQYGRTLFRHQWANAIPQLKAIIWKQGENEAGGAYVSAADYSTRFDRLYRQWRQDYGSKPRIYLGQINFLPDPNPSAAGIRDFQRRTKYRYPNLETIATVGATGFDGVHYNREGNLQIANELFRQLARDLYGSTDTSQINSPDIQKVFYSPAKDSLTLVFDEGMQMVWPADSSLYDPATGQTYVRRMQDFLYLDGAGGLVRSGSAAGNRIRLALTQPATATQLTYLPAYLNDAYTFFYNGVHLKNSRGMRAFTFYRVPIADALPTVTLRSVTLLPANQVRLTWEAPATPPDFYLIERAVGSPSAFAVLGRVGGTATQFVDETLPATPLTVFYRLKAVSRTSESPYSAVGNVQTADLTPADLSVTLTAASRIIFPDVPVRVSVTVRNAGPGTAGRVRLINRLPPGMAFVAGDNVAPEAGAVTMQVLTLAPGTQASWTYLVKATGAGRFINALEVLESSVGDPDSTPGSGTADGEDDAAQVDLRTTGAGAALAVSPNPNGRVLPPVASSQPAPDPAKADLSLLLTANKLAPALNDVITYTLTVMNAGGAAVPTATVRTDLPESLTLVSAAGLSLNGTTLTGQVTDIPAGGSRSLSFQARVVSRQPIVTRAYISASSVADPDSTPANTDLLNGEDDSAQLRLRVN